MLLGMGARYARSIPGAIAHFMKTKVIFSLWVDSEEDIYKHIHLWFTRHPRASKFKKRILRRVVASSAHDPEMYEPGISRTKERSMEIGPGWYVLWYRKRPVLFVFQREKEERGGRFVGYREDLEMWFPIGGKLLAQAFVSEVEQTATEAKAGIHVYTPEYNCWTAMMFIQPRPLSSLVFANNLADDIRQDVVAFLGNKSWYTNRGIPWRRGFLLYGAPGNGKTSLAVAIAGSLRIDVYILPLASNGLNDESLTNFMAKLPSPCVLLLEDIDAVFKGRDKAEGSKEGGITFAGLLNALDGALAPEGRVVFMTTNHKEVLDPALIRPGRADRHILINNATEWQKATLFDKFFPEVTRPDREAILQHLEGMDVSMAALQEIFIKNLNDFTGILKEGTDATV